MTWRHQSFLLMALGFAVWMAALSLLYAIQATGCALSWHHIMIGPISLLRTLLFAVLAVHVGALLWLYLHCRKRLKVSATGVLEVFLWRASTTLSAAAIVATLWIGLVLVFPLTLCA